MLDQSTASNETCAEPRVLDLPRSAVRVLAACAHAARGSSEACLRDDVAERTYTQLGGRFDAFSEAELQATALRALLLDELSDEFLARHPGGLGVGVMSMLGTRAHRLPDGRWADVDSPMIAALRQHLLPKRPGWAQLGCCPFHCNWVDAVSGSPRRPLFVVLDESASLTPSGLIQILDLLSTSVVAGSQLGVAFDERVILRPASAHPEAALEVVVPCEGEESTIVRYPRLRFIPAERQGAGVRAALGQLNAAADSGHRDAISLAHLTFI